MSNEVISERELIALIELAELLGQPTIARDLAAASEMSLLRGRRIAVAGLVKRGKSTLINSILGVDLSPVNLLPETSSVLCFTRSTRERAHGVTFEGKMRKLSTRASTFSEEVSREAKRPLLAATFEGEVSLPEDFCLIDTPGAYETEVAVNSMVSSGMPRSLFQLCDGFIVVMGVPGVSATDIALLKELNRVAKNAPVRVLLKALDSGISFSDLKEYASEVLAEVPNQIFVSSDQNQQEIASLINSFHSVIGRSEQQAAHDSHLVVESSRQTVRSMLHSRSDRDVLELPTRFLKDLPDDIAQMAASFARGERERRIAEQEKLARKVAQEAHRAEMNTWNAKNNDLLQQLRNSQASLRSAEQALQKARPSLGCGAWFLLAISCVAFPVGPIVVGAILWFANSSEEKAFNQARPRLQAQIDSSREAVERSQRLVQLHQDSKPIAR
jgi:GTPase Era involved in 16S rRNA processing